LLADVQENDCLARFLGSEFFNTIDEKRKLLSARGWSAQFHVTDPHIIKIDCDEVGLQKLIEALERAVLMSTASKIGVGLR
jgi:hypothetical protein